jgi:2-C-methyl-D-erythritol 4-phosphate cytidylyltransferase
MPSTTSCYALVPCAGTGLRSGSKRPKQYVRVAGAPLVCHTLAALDRVVRLSAILVVVAPDDDRFETAVPEFNGPRHWLARCGGGSRAQSVAQGLRELASRGARSRDWVLVHDAARCLVQPEWIDRLIDACWDDEVGGLLAQPVADTLKRGAADRVVETVDRQGLWAAQTPQMFRLDLLRLALADAGNQATDESSAIENLGYSPRLVRGPSTNFKVTWPEDFELAERMLAPASSAVAPPLADRPRFDAEDSAFQTTQAAPRWTIE